MAYHTKSMIALVTFVFFIPTCANTFYESYFGVFVSKKKIDFSSVPGFSKTLIIKGKDHGKVRQSNISWLVP